MLQLLLSTTSDSIAHDLLEGHFSKSSERFAILNEGLLSYQSESHTGFLLQSSKLGLDSHQWLTRF